MFLFLAYMSEWELPESMPRLFSLQTALRTARHEASRDNLKRLRGGALQEAPERLVLHVPDNEVTPRGLQSIPALPR